MYARIVRARTDAANLEETKAKVEGFALPRLQGFDGFKGAYYLADEVTGEITTVVLFGSKEQLAASEDAHRRTWEQGMGNSGAEFLGSQECRVLAHSNQASEPASQADHRS